jgi:hypothetical protein
VHVEIMEEWKESRGIFVSNIGRVRIEATGVAYYPQSTNGRYLVAVKAGKRLKVHTLVAEAFLGPRPSQNHTVDHIDRDTKNNRAENLRWCTKSEQVTNRILPKNKAGSRPIEVKFGDGPWNECPSVQAAAREYGFNHGTLSQLLHGKGRARTVNGAVVRFKALNDEEQYPGERWAVAGAHVVSSYGRVEDNRWHNRYVPKPQPESGYCKAFGSYVHRLVMEAFGTQQPSPNHTIDHINQVRHDNRIENLRWASKVQQNENQKKKRKNDSSAMAKAVVATLPDGTSLHFASAMEAEKSTAVGSRRISEACSGKAWNKHNKHVHKGSGIRFDWKDHTLEDNLDLPSIGEGSA